MIQTSEMEERIEAMRATVKTGLAAPTSTLPGPIKLKTKAHDVYTSAQTQEGTARKAIDKVPVPVAANAPFV